MVINEMFKAILISVHLYVILYALFWRLKGFLHYPQY